MKFKKFNKKGFNLIELIAVILILAVIALIAIPVIANIIEDTKKNSSIDSAYNYMREIEYYIASQDIGNYENKILNDKTYKVNEGSIYEDLDNISDIYLNDLIHPKNGYPNDGYVEIANDKINYAIFSISGYNVECTETDNCKVIGKYVNNLINATNILISNGEDDKYLQKDNTLQLIANIEPADATNKTITWSSSDESIATVDSNGLVTAIANGTVLITATTGKTISATFELIVSPFYVNGKTYLYRDGLINDAITGGFVVRNQVTSASSVVEFNVDHIYMYSSLTTSFARRFYSINKIDLKNYSSLNIKYKALSQIDTVYNSASLAITSLNTQYSVTSNKSISKYGIVTEPITLTLDISGFPNEYYFSFAAGSLNKVYIYEIWLS